MSEVDLINENKHLKKQIEIKDKLLREYKFKLECVEKLIEKWQIEDDLKNG